MSHEDDGNRAPHWAEPEPDGALEEENYPARRAQSLMEETRDIEQRQSTWHQVNLWHSTLYSNRVLPAFHWGDTFDTVAEMAPANQTTENLVLSIGDAMLSKAASSPLKPTPIPRGASFKTRRMIKKLDRWLYGTWRQLKCEELARSAFLDAYVAGVGVLRVDHDGDKLTAESVFFDNLIIDAREAANRAPIRTWRIRAAYPREAVEARYGAELDDDKCKYNTGYRPDAGTGYVVVVEAWRMPLGDSPGRHVVACGDKLLVDEPWTRPSPPLVVMHFRPSLNGFHSPSGAEQVVPYQINLNKLNQKIKQAQDIALTPRILAQTGSRLNINQLDNSPGQIWYHSGPAPVPFIWPAMSQELYAERDRERARCFEDFGISQMSATATLPPGVRLDSSAAVREFRSVEDTRFLDLWTRFEDFRMELAKLLVDVMIHDPDSDHTTTWYAGGKYKAATIHWSEMKGLMADHFSWSMDPVALSSMSPASRKDTLNDWLQRGMIGPDEARSMSGQPDLESIDDLETASKDAIHAMLDACQDGDYRAPDPTDNLTYGVPKFLYALKDLEANYEDVPVEVLDSMREWLRVAKSHQNEVVTDPTMQAPGPGPAMGIGGTEMPNNSQGFPGQPFAGAPGSPPAPPVSNGLPPMGPPMPPMPQ